jgi:poly(3-hydroxybutyrate) depolymerase
MGESMKKSLSTSLMLRALPMVLVALPVAGVAAPSAPAGAAAPTGEQTRAYTFAPTGETMHYRLFVPASYDPARPMPLVIVLHGAGGDETRAFDHTGLQAIAEQRGYMVLAVRGYSPFGGYGNFYPVVVTHATAARGKDFSKQAAAGPANPPPRAEGHVEPPAALDDYVEQPASQLVDAQGGALSEQEVLAALADVRKSYNVDPRRLYLMGNSAGGVGTLAMAAHEPQLFAAIAPSAGAIAAWSYPYWRLRDGHVPVLFIHGERDEHANAHWSQAMAQAARADGVDATFLLVPGGSHVRAWTMVLPQTFDFFAAHVRPGKVVP